MVEEQLFTKASETAVEIETKFLTSKFGNDQEICALAKHAILAKQIKFSRQLNQALKVLGLGSKENILLKLLMDYPEFARVAFVQIGRKDLIKNIKKTAPEQKDRKWEDQFDRAIQTGNIINMKTQLEKFDYVIIEEIYNQSGKVIRPKMGELDLDIVEQSYETNFELMRIMGFEKKMIKRYIVKA